MRIALFHDSVRIGGAELYLLEIARGALAAGLDVHVVSPEGVLPPFLRERLDEPPPIHVLPARPTFGRGFARDIARAAIPVAQVARAIRRLRPDVVHVNNGGYPGSHLARSALVVSPRPRLMSVHAVPQPRRVAAHAVMDGVVWAAADAVLTGTRAAADALLAERAMPRKLTRVITYGVRRPAVDEGEAARVRHALAPYGSVVAGMVVAPDASSDVQYKGYEVLLDALAAGPETVVAVLVGHDPGDDFRRQAARLGALERIAFIGPVPSVAPYLAAMDVLVVPSTRYESLPLVAVEALGVGTPVLASRLAGIPEAVVDGETGYTFEPGDAAKLADLLHELVRDKQLRAKLAAQAKSAFERKFAVERMVTETLAVYDELARRH